MFIEQKCIYLSNWDLTNIKHMYEIVISNNDIQFLIPLHSGTAHPRQNAQIFPVVQFFQT